MHILTDLVFVVLAATALVALLSRFKMPSLLGFLLTGLALGPVGLGAVEDAHAIEVMAEIGVVLLMFTIGLEVSLKELAKMAGRVLGGGALQMGLTVGLTVGVGWLLGVAPGLGAVVGLVLAASSTALVLRLLGDQGELGRPHGRLALAILLFQDFAVVALMLLVPLMAGEGGGLGELAWSLGRAALIAGGIYGIGRFAFPWVLRRLVALRSREVSLLMTLGVALGTAWVAGQLGLSLALGAFIAGLVISESEFSHAMFSEIMPFRDAFNGLFFISVGLLVRPEVVMAQPLQILGLVVLVMAGKGAVVVGVARLFRLSWADALLAGVGLSQVGEFGFVLAQQAAGSGLLDEQTRGVILSVSVVTMALTPLLLPATRHLVARLGGTRPDDAPPLPEGSHALEDHVIVVGFGVNGQNVTRALGLLGVRFVVVEMNLHTVEAEVARGVPIVLGDATRPSLLEHLGISRARALVVAIADPAATREIVACARPLNPNLLIIARTRYIAELEPLVHLGADRVVPEEFETSLELVGQVMGAYGALPRAIEREKTQLRQARYGALRGAPTTAPRSTLDALLDDVAVEQLELEADHHATGQSLMALEVRTRTGATVLAVLRGDHAEASPSASLALQAGDVVVLVGRAEQVSRAVLFLKAGGDEEGWRSVQPT